VPNPILETRALSYHANGSQSPDAINKILKSIDLSVDPQQIFALIGPSGSGKSTLLKLLCRLLEPSEGEIHFQSKNILEMDPRALRREVVLVFQSPVLVGKNVLEDLALGFHFSSPRQPTPDNEAWAVELLSKVDLAPRFLHESPKTLSQGEAHRVSLARALAIRPKVLLLDEPTSSLDVVSKKVIEDALREASKEGMTIVLVSHDPSQVDRLAEHGLELFQGNMKRSW